MDFKAHARYSLQFSRGFIERQLEDFRSPSDWVYRPTDHSNHALWIAGHLALADNMFAARFREATAYKPDGYEEKFWFGTECTADSAAYPPADEVLAYFRDRRENLLGVLDELSDEELSAPGPGPDERSPIAGAPSAGHIFLFASQHEMGHAGQVSVCRRGLGNEPMFRP